jgi:EmrB/QacA subfamily drug resistance transporter
VVNRNYRTIAIVVSTSLFMQYLDSSILITALPTIARSLKVEALDLNLALISYQIAMAIFIPVGNRVADMIGGRNTFMASLAIFLIGSIFCGLSSTLSTLILSRTIQGAGGGLMVAVGRLIVVRSAERHELISALNWMLAPAIIGPMLGPPLGGFIVGVAHWSWIFFINVPIAVLGIVLSWLLVPNIRPEQTARFDIRGMVLMSGAVGFLSYGLGEATHADLPVTLTMLALGGAFFGSYVVHYRRVASPFLDLALVKVDSFRHSMVVGTILRIASTASGFILPLWIQLAMNVSAFHSGLIIFLIPAGSLLARFVLNGMLSRISPRTTLIAGATLLTVWILLLATALYRGQIWSSAPLILGMGILLTLSMTVVSAMAYVDLEAKDMGAGTSLYTVVQQLALSGGVTCAVLMLGGIHLLGGYSQHDASAYFLAELGVAALALTAALMAARLPPEIGEALVVKQPARS